MEAALRLFHGVVLHENAKGSIDTKHVENVLKQTIEFGVIIAPEIITNFSKPEIEHLVSLSKRLIGLSAEQMNESFHKSWYKVATAPARQLVFEQIVHYITTYGFERLGIYDKDSVYIPHESLKIPKLKDDFKATVVKGYTFKEMRSKLATFLGSGISLKEQTMNDAVELAIALKFDEKDISGVKNKEARIVFYSMIGKIPADPVEFLRLVVYTATGKTLLVKNDATFSSLKETTPAKLVNILAMYEARHGLKPLSTIFNRFKPVFLSMRLNNTLSHQVNVISKLSKDHHVPMKPDFLNEVTAMITSEKGIDVHELSMHLENASIFRKARLAATLRFRSTGSPSVLYKIRNGKAYATSKGLKAFYDSKYFTPVLDIVMDSIAGSLKHVAGKRIYIPEGVTYALPATEKQFSGNFPSGSSIDVGEDLVIGIHWNNVGGERVDLDFSMSDATRKYGWDASYRSSDGTILFSGDMTDAHDGASEMFHVSHGITGDYKIAVNNYTFSNVKNVPFTIYIGTENRKILPKNFMIDPNNVVARIPSMMNERQRILGMVSVKIGKARVFFSETNLGESITIRKSEHMENALRYLITSSMNQASLNDVLVKAGATIVSDPAEKKTCDVDLSLETVTKDTFLNMILGNEKKI